MDLSGLFMPTFLLQTTLLFLETKTYGAIKTLKCT